MESDSSQPLITGMAKSKGRKTSLSKADIDAIQTKACDLIATTGMPLKLVGSPEFGDFLSLIWTMSTGDTSDLSKVPLSRKSYFCFELTKIQVNSGKN